MTSSSSSTSSFSSSSSSSSSSSFPIHKRKANDSSCIQDKYQRKEESEKKEKAANLLVSLSQSQESEQKILAEKNVVHLKRAPTVTALKITISWIKLTNPELALSVVDEALKQDPENLEIAFEKCRCLVSNSSEEAYGFIYKLNKGLDKAEKKLADKTSTYEEWHHYFDLRQELINFEEYRFLNIGDCDDESEVDCHFYRKAINSGMQALIKKYDQECFSKIKKLFQYCLNFRTDNTEIAKLAEQLLQALPSLPIIDLCGDLFLDTAKNEAKNDGDPYECAHKSISYYEKALEKPSSIQDPKETSLKLAEALTLVGRPAEALAASKKF